jgi:hypothetical protein
MVVFYPTIPAFLLPWIPEQHLYFVGTAPLVGNGHVNLSPKCMRGTFHVESESRVWYEDLTGSGACLVRVRLSFFAFPWSNVLCTMHTLNIRSSIYLYTYMDYSCDLHLIILFSQAQKRSPTSRSPAMSGLRSCSSPSTGLLES